MEGIRMEFLTIDIDKAYSLKALSAISTSCKATLNPTETKLSTVRENLKKLGVPVPKLGDQAFVPGRLIYEALVRQGQEIMAEHERGQLLDEHA